MTKKIKYSVDAEKLIAYRCFSGDIFVGDIIDSWLELMKKTDLSRMKGVLNDFTDASLKLRPDDLKEIISVLNKNRELFLNLKIAVVTESPANVVFPTLASHNNPEFRIRPFSTPEAAEEWIIL